METRGDNEIIDTRMDGTVVEALEASNGSSPETADDSHARLRHALHELEAAKVRVQRDARIVHDETRAKLVAELLPVLDDLDRTIVAAESCGDSPAVVEGVKMVRRRFENVLVSYGLERLHSIGLRFDPTVHEAVSTIQVAADRDYVVVDQLLPGYKFGGRLLRAATVVVGRYVAANHP